MVGKIKAKVFLSHTSADKPAVRKVYESLRHYSDVEPWLDENHILPADDLLEMITGELSRSSHVVVFWSKNALNKYDSKKGVGNLSWVAFEIRAMPDELSKAKRKFIVVRLDDAPWPKELMAHFSLLRYVDAKGLLDSSRADHNSIVWRAATEIIASIRGRVPLYPSLELLKEDGRYFFVHTWADGQGGNRTGSAYIESLDWEQVDGQRGRKLPAVKYGDGCFGYRISIPAHTKGGWWAAVVSFGDGDTTWRTVDLSKYKEMRFNARASEGRTPLAIRLADKHQGSKIKGGHNETSNHVFHLGINWRTGAPWILYLDELDWSINAFPGNEEAVNRCEILQIVFNDGQLWDTRARWIEVKNIVFL